MKLRRTLTARVQLLTHLLATSPAAQVAAACRRRLEALLPGAEEVVAGGDYLRLCRELQGLERRLWQAEDAHRRSQQSARDALGAALGDAEAALPELAGLADLLWEVPLDPGMPQRLAALRGLLMLRHDSVPRILAMRGPWKK